MWVSAEFWLLFWKPLRDYWAALWRQVAGLARALGGRPGIAANLGRPISSGVGEAGGRLAGCWSRGLTRGLGTRGTTAPTSTAESGRQAGLGMEHCGGNKSRQLLMERLYVSFRILLMNGSTNFYHNASGAFFVARFHLFCFWWIWSRHAIRLEWLCPKQNKNKTKTIKYCAVYCCMDGQQQLAEMELPRFYEYRLDLVTFSSMNIFLYW